MTRPTPRKLKIVCYAINGSGVGHVTRLVAIARWLRRYLTYLGIQPEIYFLSSSEASTLLFRERFACFKVPSKTTVREAGIPKTTYLALAKQWVWNSLGLIRPDLFIVDTFPGGSFGELLNALDLCRTKAFIYRPLKADFARSPGFQAMLPLYDAVIVPAKKDNAAALPVPARARAAVSYTGPIIVRDRAELADRAAARARLGVPHDRLAVYISAGGGGDENSEAQLRAALSAIADDPRLHAVVGAGPLFRGQRPHRANVTWLAHEQAVEVMPGFDLAVAACGYNTFHELMLTGVPTVFLPQPKIADQQDLRAEQAARAGAAALLGPRPTAEAIRAALAPWLDNAARAEASAAARALVPRSHARDAAQELLRLVLPGSVVEAAEEALTEELVASSRHGALDLEGLFGLMAALDARPRGELGSDEAAELSDATGSLAATLQELQLGGATAQRLVEALSKKLPTASITERGAAAETVLHALAPFADWAGAALLLRAFRTERKLAAASLAEAVAGFLNGLASEGADLYEGLRRLARAQGDPGTDPPTNAELLASAAAEPVR